MMSVDIPNQGAPAGELPASWTVIAEGGVTSASGFSAAGLNSGLKADGVPDMALVVAEETCAVAGVFTKSVFCAAPITVCREHLESSSYGTARAMVINSGNANAATGEPGLKAARNAAEITAKVLDCAPEDVLVASTGVIGVHLPGEPFLYGVPAAASALSPQGGHDAACAIMTTDTVPKEFAISYESAFPEVAGPRVTIGGMAKGSGMIMPDMATMIAVLTTDAPLVPEATFAALGKAVSTSFNKVTVDTDTSTNDTCILFANGKASSNEDPTGSKAPAITEGTPAFDEFAAALAYVCETLARKIAADGEGATKLITVTVEGAASEADADAAARAVANSPLVKTAIFGHDANWGRIAMALGKSGAAFKQEQASIDIMGMPVCRKGLTVPFDEEEARRRFKEPEIVLHADLGAGPHTATVWTCDLSHEYVTINGDYRT